MVVATILISATTGAAPDASATPPDPLVTLGIPADPNAAGGTGSLPPTGATTPTWALA